jgi:hypothetical protein
VLLTRQQEQQTLPVLAQGLHPVLAHDELCDFPRLAPQVFDDLICVPAHLIGA